MGLTRWVGGTGRAVAGVGIAAVAALHAVWTTGSAWPANSARQLAEAVTGDTRMPPRSASGTMAVLLAVAAVVVSARRGGVLQTLFRLGLTGVLGLRAALDSDTTTGLLGMRAPARRFRELNDRWYRPLCALLALASLCAAFGARRR